MFIFNYCHLSETDRERHSQTGKEESEEEDQKAPGETRSKNQMKIRESGAGRVQSAAPDPGPQEYRVLGIGVLRV